MAKIMTPTELVSADAGAYTIIDVRDSETFASGSAEGAINIPLNPQTGAFGEAGYLSTDEAMKLITSLSADKPVAVMCYHGMMSQYGAAILEQLGFDAYSVADGYPGYLAALQTSS